MVPQMNQTAEFYIQEAYTERLDPFDLLNRNIMGDRILFFNLNNNFQGCDGIICVLNEHMPCNTIYRYTDSK